MEHCVKMDDFWNISETTPSTLDNFFDEESNVNWTGSNKEDSDSLTLVSPSSNPPQHSSPTFPNDGKGAPKTQHKSSLSSSSLSSILDNISVHSDSAISGISATKAKNVGRALGEKIESWKPPSGSFKWKSDGNSSCLQCHTKDEQILQLKQRLERAYSRHTVTLPPEDTIRRMLLGLPHSLESYKMLEDKISLLEVAVATMDASAILSVLVFMRNTSKKSFFLKELQKHPLASQVYINHLKERLENTDVLEILGLLGKTEEAALFKYELAVSSPSGESQVKNLRNAFQTNFSDPSLSYEAKMVKQHLDLTELQIPIDTVDSKDQSNPMLLEHPRATCLLGQPLLTTLYYCAMYHWQAGENAHNSPLYLKKHFNIPDRQFLWTIIKARAKVKHWPLPADLENLLAARGLMGTLSSALSGISGGAKLVKNNLPIETVVHTLASTDAPPNVLASYIDLLGSNETKLRLGLAYKCYQAVIECSQHGFTGLRGTEGSGKLGKVLEANDARFSRVRESRASVEEHQVENLTHFMKMTFFLEKSYC